MNNVQFGWLVWCVGEDFREPEGTVFFDHEPAIGETVKLGDGKDWTITRLNPDSLELNAELGVSPSTGANTASLSTK